MIKIVKLLLFLVFLIKKLYTFFIKTLLNAILSNAENRKKKHFKNYTFLAEMMVLNICIQNSLASVEHTTIRNIGILNKAK